MIPMPPPEVAFTNTVWAVAYRPDGKQVLVAAGDRIFIYNALNGEVIDSKKAHKDVVYCLAYSKDGQRWASGGADNNVIVWSAEGTGLLKYSHNSKIQALAFNPVLQSLASATDKDFGLWQTEG
jgi:intraflagellar transport protein 122